jgi:serine/threonine protein kinase
VQLTRAGLNLGTVAYMAPEQIEGREVDGRTDQYALTCAAFELLAGVAPFDHEQDMAVLYAHLSQPPPLLAARRPGLPPASDEVLARALAKAPADRYPSCRDFTDALRQAFGLPAYDHDPGLSGSVPARTAMAPGAPGAPGAPAPVWGWWHTGPILRGLCAPGPERPVPPRGVCVPPAPFCP